ncbi:hypothetical protein IFM89_011016 [Coptis chinensis]|uniref:Uncharacterized protein n=1 Tax=Coptis chinensis TaxID=261450 RepID=A0A835ILQ2_9MAGN|nr:hypothetical protein IFM89_011016 [Coptis chinensis]
MVVAWVKGPSLFSDIGKKTRDLLYKDYRNGYNVSLSTEDSSGSVNTTSVTRVGRDFFAGLNMQMAEGQFIPDIKVDQYSRVFMTLKLNEVGPGMKAIAICSRSRGNIELRWLHDYAAISTRMFYYEDKHPRFNVSCMVGSRVLSFGTDVSFDFMTRDTKCGAGMTLSYKNLTASLTLKDNADSLNASFCHVLSPFTSTVIGADYAHNFLTDEGTVTLGAQHALNSKTMVKARVNYCEAGVAIQHQWCLKVFSTISGEVNLMAMEQVPKLGMAMTLNI